MEFIAGFDAAIAVGFLLRGQPSVPTMGSVYYTLLDHSGAALVGYQNVAVTTTTSTTTVSISLPAAIMTVDSNKQFEIRTLMVRYITNGLSYNIVKKIRVVPLLAHSVTPETVRVMCGLNSTELKDEMIDITAAYFAVEDELTTTVLSEALISGTADERNANELIAIRCVLNLLPSLKVMMAQSETNGIVGFTRATNIDFDDLGLKLSGRYGDLMTAISGRSEIASPMLVMTLPVDVITGA